MTKFAPELLRQIEKGELDWIVLSSPLIAQSQAIARRIGRVIGTRIRLASISPATSEAAREVGLPVAAEAEVHTWDGLFEATMRAQGARRC